MNTPASVTIGFDSLFSLAGVWILLFWLYRDFRLDVFRQELFALRDRLFDSATHEPLTYDHPAYGTLRQTINGFIRFGHRLTLSQVILLYASSRWLQIRPIDSFDVRWDRVSADLPESVRAELENIIQSLHKAVMRYLILNSPLLVISVATVVVPIIFLIVWRFFLKTVLRVSSRPFRLVDSVAVVYGA